jgi:hypothetical protein
MKMKLALSGIALGATMAMAATVARATVYDYNFTTNDGGPVVSMTGAFTTTGPATPTGVEITGMTGTLMNSLDTVIGVVLNPSYPGSSYSPDGGFIYDNAQYSSQPYLDNPGVLFITAANHPPSGGVLEFVFKRL